MKKYTFFLALIVINFFISTTLTAQITAKEWLVKADGLFNQKKYSEALLAYEKTTELDKRNVRALHMTGWCSNDNKNYNKAIVVLQKALEITTTNNEVYQELGYAYKKLQKYDDALYNLIKAKSLNAKYKETYVQLADVYAALGKKADALASYKTLLEIDPTNIKAPYEIGYLFNGLEKYDSALVWLNKALTIKETVAIYNEIGFANYKLKKNDEAIKAYDNTTRLDGKNGTAYKGRGDVYRRNYSPAKISDAIIQYQKAVELNPKSSGSFYGLGWCYIENKNYEEAKKVLNTSITLDPTLTIAYTELGYSYYITKNYTDAVTTFKKALTLDSKSSLSAYYLGITYIAQNDRANAQQMLIVLQNLKSDLATKLEAKLN